MRLKVSHLLALAVVAALAVGLVAEPAMARPAKAQKTHRLSAKQKRHIRAQLRKQVKKNPAVVKRRAFLKKAALVNFNLPVTIRLRGVPSSPSSPNTTNGNYCYDNANQVPFNTSCTAYNGSNPNIANINLGPSLGQRQVSLGGALSGNIVFHDSYDGGALGNVDLELKPDTNSTGPDHTLKTTSIPLLWNNQVSIGRFDANDLGLLDNPPANGNSGYGVSPQPSGCSDFKTGGNDLGPSGQNGFSGYNVASTTFDSFSPYGTGYVTFARGFKPLSSPPTNTGLIGYPYFQSAAAVLAGSPNGYLGIKPGVDGINQLSAGDYPGSNTVLGPTPNPFPTGTAPGGFTPTVQDTVLRTNALSLNIAGAGQSVKQSSPESNTPNHPTGSQDIVIGKSGGQANLFGNIPGKGYGIDITASFATKISSIIRVVDQDSFHHPLITGEHWPAGVFNCAQVWTGYVQNYIPGVRLQGSLKIAPGLTSDGHLRIAKATVSSPSGNPARFAVAACLAPQANYKDNGSNGQGGVGTDSDRYSDYLSNPSGGGLLIPDPGTGTGLGAHLGFENEQPLDPSHARPAPPDECNQKQTGLLRYSAVAPAQVPTLTGGVVTDGYDSTDSGDMVSVAADLNVQNVSVDVLIGDV